MRSSEYTVQEMKEFIGMMSGMYDLARVVDPVECRVLDFGEDGSVAMCGSCYDVWQADQRCINCSSFAACRTGAHAEKTEHFKDQLFRIHSNPVRLKLPDGGIHDAVVELISITKDTDSGVQNANDRESENIDFKAVHYQAHHDVLTRVLNAEAFYELSRNKIIENPNTSWVLIAGDIMEFRMVNDLFGYIRGNEVLVKTAELLHDITHEAGGLCGRLSGDHFALLIPEIMFKEERLIEISRALTDMIRNSAYSLKIHFGVYTVTDASIPVSVMCDRANIALLTIKQDARETVAYFDQSLMQKRLFEQEVISGFDQVLREGQFQIYLQPLSTKDGVPFGAEALVRWIRPDGSIVPPGDFIGILEKAGLIPELDTYVWELAVKQLAAWKGTDKEHLSISVNMSARDLYYIDIYSVLTGLLEKYDVDSSRLRIEITETALIGDPEKTAAVLEKLRRAGFFIEIDDFGKGYSSLIMLRDINADMIKIDMGFLRVTRNRERNRSILRWIIGLAKDLGMEVVTEGVETKEQVEILSEMGCSCFQGYYFSRPVPVGEFEELFRKRNICQN